MSTDEPDAEDLAEAFPHVAQLEEQLKEADIDVGDIPQRKGTTRRDLLAGSAGLLGLGGILTGATGGAQAGDDQAGQFGTQAAPLDGYVEDLYDKNGNRVAELPGDGSLDVLQDLSAESVTITDTRDVITVDVPTDYDTVQQAVDEISKQSIPTKTRVDVNIESGHRFKGLMCTYGAYNYFRLISEDSTVLLDTNEYPGDGSGGWVIGAKGAFAPQLGCLIDGQGGGSRGFSVAEGSIAPKFYDGVASVGVKNVNGTACRIGGGSSANIRPGIFSDSKIGLFVAGSLVRASNIDVSGSSQNGIGVQRASVVSAQNANITGCGADAVVAKGRIDLANSDLSGAGGVGVNGRDAVTIHGEGVTVSNCSGTGVSLGQNARANLYGATITNNGDKNLLALGKCDVDARDADLSGATNDDIHCLDGSEIALHGATTTNGTPSINDIYNHSSFNAVSSAGIVFA